MNDHVTYREFRTIEDAFMKRLCDEVVDNLENLFIEGLKLKGYEFVNRIYLENFIINNVRCEEHQLTKERIYFVNNIPFFLHKYETVDQFNTFQEDRSYKVSINLGHYKFL